MSSVTQIIDIDGIINGILTGETSCCPDLQVLIGEDGNVLTGEL